MLSLARLSWSQMLFLVGILTDYKEGWKRHCKALELINILLTAVPESLSIFPTDHL